MKLISRIVFTALLVLSYNQLSAQISSTGKTFYFSFMEMEARSGGYPDSLLVYITSEVNTTITIDNPRIPATSQTMNIVAGKVNRYSADPGFYYPQGYEKPSSDIESKRSLRIVAKDPINVYTLNLELNRSDGTFVLPYESIPLAPEFYITAFTPTQYTGGKYMPSQFVIVGMDNNVTVEITPTTKLASGKAAGTAFTVTLTRGQVYQVQSDPANGATGGNSTVGDLTGTRVRVINGCGKINVFAGMRSVKIPSSACGIAVDHLYTQVFPTTILGKSHVVMPFKDQTKGYVFRVLATKPSTKIYVDGTLRATKNAGEWYQEDVTTEVAKCVTADSEIYVIQYMKNGGTCAGTTGNNGDPAILIMPDWNQKMLKTVVGTATTNNMNKHYVNILVPKSAKNVVKLNGTTLASSNFIDVNCANHAYAKISVGNPSTNTIECDSGLIVVAYGIGQYESYSYCSGALFENLDYDFTWSRKGKCPGESVKLESVTNNPKIKSIHWDFGDGGIDTGKTVYHKFQKVGAFFVKMKVAVPGACGTTDTIIRSKIIDILQGPVFELPDTVFQCTNTLSYPFVGPVKNSFFYKWHDSSTSNSYTAKSPGKVWFRVYDTFTKCTLYDSSFVKQYSPLDVKVSMDTNNMCRPTNFFSMSDNTGYINDSYKSAVWRINRWHLPVSKRDTFSTLPRMRISFDTLGQFPVKYIVTSKLGCVDSTSFNLGVYRMPTAIFNTAKSEYCQKEPITFIDSSTGEGGIKTGHWDYGNGSTGTGLKVTYSYDNYDTFRVRLITETVYGCRDTVDSAIIVHPLPVMAMGVTTNNVCKNANSFTFKDNSTIPHGSITNSWKYEKITVNNQGTLSNIKFSDTGTWAVRLYHTSDKGCKDSVIKTVYVAPEPKAIISLLDSMKCFDKHYFDLDDVSTISKGTIGNRKWSFSDGTSATTKLVSKKKFTAYGVYNVKLVVTSATYGCKDSISRNLQVFAAPKAPFGINDSVQCDVGNSFDFIPNSSFFVSGVTPTFKWTFGDGATATTENATHSYSSTGTYNVKFVISTSQGCTDSATRVAEVVATPKAIFTTSKDSSCLGSHRYDYTNGTSFGGGFTSKWSLGDGTNATTTDISQKNYTTPATYTVKLVVTTAQGCKDSTTRTVHVLPIPAASMSINSKLQCFVGHNFIFNNTTNTNGANPVNYNWVITPGSTFNTQNIPNQTMPDTGLYTIRLTATSGFGCSSTANDAVYVAENPTVSITAGDACAGFPIKFNSNASVTTGSIVTYQWNFGDGNSSGNPGPSHTYNTANTYNVQLTVTSDKGCSATAGPVVANVFPRPVAGFNSVQTESRGIETDHVLTFTGSGASLYQWTFHDGQSSTSPGPVKVTFKEQGLKPVTLLVISANGCRDSITKSILLNPELQMWITNTFSPNDDGLNEVFGPSTTFGLSNYRLNIYDRWGSKMFESVDPANRWNGTDSSGEPAPEGVYAYHMVFRYVDGKLFVFRGTVTLLR